MYDLGWIFRDADLHDHAHSLYVICFEQLTRMQRRSVLHPSALRVLGDIAYERLRQGMEPEASAIDVYLSIARGRVLGQKHGATAAALLDLPKLGLKPLDPLINYNLRFSQLYKAFEMQEALLGTENILIRNVLIQLMNAALILGPPENCVLKKAKNPFAIILQQLTREHDELTSLYGEHSTQVTDATAKFASGQACFGTSSAAEEMLQKLDLRAMSRGGRFYYIFGLINLARRSMTHTKYREGA